MSVLLLFLPPIHALRQITILISLTRTRPGPVAVGLKVSPAGSSPLIAQQTATESLTAITGTMVKNGHLRTKCLSAVAVEPRP